MRINLKRTNIVTTAETEEYLAKRIEYVEKFLSESDLPVIVDVELGKTTEHHQTGNVFRAEINIKRGGKTFRAVSQKQELFAAIDDARDEIVRELRTDKKIRLSLLKRGGQKLKQLMKGLY